MPETTEPNGTPGDKALIDGIDIHNPDALHAQNAEILRRFPFERHMFTLLARSSGLFPPLWDWLHRLLSGETRTVQVLDYQLVVLRMAGTVGADYLFSINAPVSRAFEMGADKIDALSKGLKSEELLAMGVWSERQQCIITLVDESIATFTNKEETIAWAKSLMSDDEVVELFIVLGMYSMLARLTRGLRVQPDPPVPNLEQTAKISITKNANEP